MSDSISIIAADDHKLFLEGLSSLLALEGNFELITVATNGDDLVQLIDLHKPDIVLIDLSMPGSNTNEILRSSAISSPNTHLIALTMHLEAHLAKSLLSLGLSGYILKESAFEEVTLAINSVYKGDQFLSPAMIEAIKLFDSNDSEISALTARENQVLTNAALGHSNKKIANILDISERTVRFHISNSCIKLNATGRANAVAVAIKHAFIH